MKTLILVFATFLIMSNYGFAQKIDTKHIALNLKFDWKKKCASGTAEITFSPITSSNKIELNAGNLAINSVFLNNKSLQINYNGSDTSKLEIFLDRTYMPAEILKIKINYNTNYENKADPNAIWGSFGKGLRFQVPTSTTPNKRKQIWSNGEPENNKYWFPCNEDIVDIHTTELITTVEKPFMVIGNGKLLKTIDNKDNTRTFHYKTDKPFPNYLVSIVVGEYYDVLQKSGTTAIHNFGYPHEKEAIKATTELLPEMMKFLEMKTGYQYPFKQYSQAVVQDYPFPGLVGQHTAAIMSDNYIDDHGVHKDFKYLWDGVAVQALANQWFGNLLMPKTWDDIWLNNAFAQYFAGLWTEHNNTKDEYNSYIQPFEKGAVLGDWQAEYKHPVGTNKYEDLTGFTRDNYSKFRGALVLRMLQKEVGEANWWKAIQLYVKTNAFKQVATADFQKAIEKASGKSYQWFFDQWIYKIGLPKLEVTKHFVISKKQLQLTVKQIHKKDSSSKFEEVKFFKGNINIEIDNKIETVFLEPKAETLINISLPKAPSFVNFNYEDTWLCETEFKKNTAEYLTQLTQSKDVLAKQQALDKLVEIAKDSNTTSVLKGRIIAAFKKEIISNQYWRYRQYALVSLRNMTSLPYDAAFIDVVLGLIKNETGWLKASAIVTLGNTNDSKYFDIYKNALKDESDRVINAAATAIGKTKHLHSFQTLLNLDNKPSWKSQSRISALNGLQQLGDTNAVNYVLNCLSDNQSPRWYLATPVWDYPFAAVNTLVALGKANLGYPILLERFKKSLVDNDFNDIFQNVQLIDLLKDEKAKEMYNLLKAKYKGDSGMMETIKNYEKNYLESILK